MDDARHAMRGMATNCGDQHAGDVAVWRITLGRDRLGSLSRRPRCKTQRRTMQKLAILIAGFMFFAGCASNDSGSASSSEARPPAFTITRRGRVPARLRPATSVGSSSVSGTGAPAGSSSATSTSTVDLAHARSYSVSTNSEGIYRAGDNSVSSEGSNTNQIQGGSTDTNKTGAPPARSRIIPAAARGANRIVHRAAAQLLLAAARLLA